MNTEIARLREVVVKLTQMLTGMGLVVTQYGAKAYVEHDPRTGKPKRVNIPNIPDNASRELIYAIQGFIDHEVAHVLFTDFNVVTAAGKNSKELKDLHNIIEDTFIERAIGKKFPGSVDNVQVLHDFFLEHITKPALREAAGDPLREFGILMVPFARALAGQQRFKDFMDEGKYWEHPLIKQLLDRLPKSAIEKMPKINSSQEALEVARSFKDVLYPDDEKDEGDGDDGDEGQSKKGGKKKSDSKKSKKPSDDSSDEDGDESDGHSGKGNGKKGRKSKKDEEEKSEDGDEGEDEKKKGKKDKKDKPDDDEGGDDGDGEGDEGEDEEDGDGADGKGGDDSKDENEEDEGEGSSGAGEEDEEGEDESTGDGEGDDGDGDDDETSAGGDEGKSSGKGKELVEKQQAKKDVNPFGSKPVDLSEADLENLIKVKITDEATRQTRSADYRVYSKEFDVIKPLDVDPSEYRDSYLTRLDDDTRHMIGVMQKDVERMVAARSQSVRVPGFRSGRLHSAALHRLTVKDDRVFRRIEEAKSKDTAVCLLTDNSGSMRGSKMATAMTAAYALSNTLERVGIKHECLGFSTLPFDDSYYYRTKDLPESPGWDWRAFRAEESRIGRPFSRGEPLHIPIYKSYDERLTPPVKKRFAYAAGHQNFLMNNVDGESVEYAALRLLKRPEKRKILIVMSDGMPAAGPAVSSELYSHLHQVVADCAKRGIELVGIGIESTAVKSFYPRYFVLNDVAELPKTVMGELKRILTT